MGAEVYNDIPLEVRKIVNFGDFMGAKVYNDLPLEVRKIVNLKLPSIKSEYARKSFYCMGAKVYNDLPLEVRKIVNFGDFMGAKVYNDLPLEVKLSIVWVRKSIIICLWK